VSTGIRRAIRWVKPHGGWVGRSLRRGRFVDKDPCRGQSGHRYETGRSAFERRTVGHNPSVRKARIWTGIGGAAAVLVALFMRSNSQAETYGSSLPLAADLLFAIGLLAPYLLLAATPRTIQSRRMEAVALVGLLIQFLFLAWTWHFITTSLSSTAGVALRWAWLAAWLWFAILSFLRHRSRSEAPPRPDGMSRNP
jgi:hypothetical protein